MKKKLYIAPLSMNVELDPLMQSYLSTAGAVSLTEQIVSGPGAKIE